MKNHPFIIWLRDLIMTALCRWNSNVTHYACCTDERWMLSLAWAVEGYLECAWWDLYVGSDEELADALDGRPLHHMTERQQAHYIGTMAEGGAN